MRRPAESGRLAHSIEVRQWLRSAAPAVHIDFAPEGEEEFVLLVARRDATGLSVIDSVPHNAALVERALVAMTCPPATKDAKQRLRVSLFGPGGVGPAGGRRRRTSIRNCKPTRPERDPCAGMA